ncbi:hypothetical protein SKAU_G00235600 [Synaphobranchus kaupii]|uniref:Reverse transcriptase domain-containing protein n=1 Tax=Synaphobranchus kaupii TaxID=118154 RepID=A0A9Q1F6J4_SYNKA|nr:hypothetical protein SKAU_G00235600 [Synaphobranchus kaupii]
MAPRTLSPVKSADGSTLIMDQKQVVDRWAEHFQTLLNQPATPDLAVLEELPCYPTIEELDLPLTFSEVLAAVRLDGNLFNIRRFQATTKVKSVNVVELQYADDCAFVAHTPEALQANLTAYSRLGLTVNTAKTKLENFHISCLQRILGLTWRDRVPHTEILARTGSKSMEATFLYHQLRWVGRTIRMPEDRLPRQLLWEIKDQRRRRVGGKRWLGSHKDAVMKRHEKATHGQLGQAIFS